MSDVYSEFLDQMEEAGDKFDSGGSSIGAVGRVKIEFGFHYYDDSYGSEYWRCWGHYKTPEDTNAAYLRVKEIAGENYKSIENGLRVTVFSENLLAGNAKIDLSKFCAKWKETGKLILENMREKQLPFNDIFYGQVKHTADPYAVAKGEGGKTKEYKGKMTFPTFLLPVQMFANKQEALTFIEANQPANNSSSEYSAKAMANFQKEEVLESNQQDIFSDVKMAYEGKKLLAAKAKHLELPVKPVATNSRSIIIFQNEILEYVAGTWDIEAQDIVSLPIADSIDPFTNEEIPF